MSEDIIPKSENENTGYHYTVSEEQIAYHKTRSVKEILIWLEETNKFIWMVQTPEEREKGCELLKTRALAHFNYIWQNN